MSSTKYQQWQHFDGNQRKKSYTIWKKKKIELLMYNFINWCKYMLQASKALKNKMAVRMSHGSFCMHFPVPQVMEGGSEPIHINQFL